MALPVLRFDFLRHPQLAWNIWDSQMLGHPKILTYAGPDPWLRRQTRNDAMHFVHAGFRYKIPQEQSRDEYPFACTDEGGGASKIAHIPSGENSAQGGIITAFLRQHAIIRGGKFRVEVINYPAGRVTAPCRPTCRGCAVPCPY